MLGKGHTSSQFTKTIASNLLSNNSVKYVASGFSRTKSNKALHINANNIDTDTQNECNSKKYEQVHQDSYNARQSQCSDTNTAEIMKRNRSLDVNLRLPGIEWAEKSVQLEETEQPRRTKDNVVFLLT